MSVSGKIFLVLGFLAAAEKTVDGVGVGVLSDLGVWLLRKCSEWEENWSDELEKKVFSLLGLLRVAD